MNWYIEYYITLPEHMRLQLSQYIANLFQYAIIHNDLIISGIAKSGIDGATNIMIVMLIIPHCT